MNINRGSAALQARQFDEESFRKNGHLDSSAGVLAREPADSPDDGINTRSIRSSRIFREYPSEESDGSGASDDSGESDASGVNRHESGDSDDSDASGVNEQQSGVDRSKFDDMRGRFGRSLMKHARAFRTSGVIPHDDELVKIHKAIDPVMGFEEFRGCMLKAIDTVKHVHGSGPLAKALAEADQAGVPACAERYEDVALRRLVGLCRRLQELNGDEPFHLAGESAGIELGICRQTVAAYLMVLRADGIIERMSKGNLRSGKASTYRYLVAEERGAADDGEPIPF